MRRLCLMLLSLTAVLATAALINRIADPYGAWQVQIIDDAFRKQFDDRLSRPYRLIRERPTTVLLGNSRPAWGVPIPGPARDGIFNGAMPGVHLGELEAMAAFAIRQPQVKRIVWFIDYLTFDAGMAEPIADAAEFRARLAGNPLQLLDDTLLSLDCLDQSRRVILRSLGARLQLAERVLPRAEAWSPTVLRAALERRDIGLARYDANDRRREVGGLAGVYRSFRLDEHSWQRIRALVNQAKSRGIDVVIVVLPTTELELEIIRQTGHWPAYLDFKCRLVELGPYRDYSGYGDLARAEHLYMDLMHPQPAMGHVILRRALGENCDGCGEVAERIAAAGVWVDAASIENYLSLQDANRARAQVSSPYTAIVAAALEPSPPH